MYLINFENQEIRFKVLNEHSSLHLHHQHHHLHQYPHSLESHQSSRPTISDWLTSITIVLERPVALKNTLYTLYSCGIPYITTNVMGKFWEILLHLLSVHMKWGGSIQLKFELFGWKSVIQTCVVETLAALAYNHPHGMVPFLKVSQ